MAGCVTAMKQRIIDVLTLKNMPPLIILFITFVNVVFYSMSTTQVFAFLPSMVKHFGATEVNAGYYAGMIASSVFVGRFFFSVLWGYLTDTIGKKNSAMLTGLCLLVMTLAFGFSQDFYWAASTRFLQGCCMGQIIVAKSILVDFCDDSNMAKGLSVVITSFSVGIVIGPSIGGFLVFPAQQYPKTFSEDGVFGKYGILLPNLVIVIGLGIGVILTFKYLPRDKRHNDVKTDDKEPVVSYKPETDGLNTEDADEEEIILYVRSESTKNEQPRTSFINKIKQSKFITVLKIRECLFSSTLYGLYAFIDVGLNEMFPLLAATNPLYKGMGFTSANIGTVYMAVTIILVVLQLTILPKLHVRFGSKKVLIACNLVLTFLCPLVPTVAAFENRPVLWVCLLMLKFSTRTCSFCAYLAINVLVNNSVGPELLGSANGFAMTFASLGRLTSPIVCGSIYSYSLTNIKGIKANKDALGFPLNQFLVFYFLSVCAIFIAVITTWMPDSMNFKKTKELGDSPSGKNG